MVHQKVRNSFYTWNHQRGPDWWFFWDLISQPAKVTMLLKHLKDFKRFFHEDYELGTCFVDASQSAIHHVAHPVRGNEVRHHGSWGDMTFPWQPTRIGCQEDFPWHAPLIDLIGRRCGSRDFARGFLGGAWRLQDSIHHVGIRRVFGVAPGSS